MARTIILDFKVNDADLKTAAQNLKDLADKIESAEKFFKDLNACIVETDKSITDFGNKTAEAGKEVDKLTKDVDQLEKKLSKLGRTSETAAKNLKDLGNEASKNAKNLKDFDDVTEKTSKDLKDLSSESKKAAKSQSTIATESQKAQKEIKQSGAAVDEYKHKIDALTQALTAAKNAQKGMGGAKFPGGGAGGKNGGGILGGMMGGAGALAGGFTMVAAAAATAGIAIAAGMAMAKERIGEIATQIKMVQTAFHDLELAPIVVPFAKEFKYDAAEAQAAITGLIQSAASMTGMDFGETLGFINTNMRAFGGSALQAAVDLSVVSAMLGPEKAKEAAEWGAEYATQFRAVGFSAKTLRNVMINSFARGVFDDKAFDFLKEFKNKINDLSTSAEKVLTDNDIMPLIKQIRDGSVDLETGLLNITGKLKEMNAAGKDIRPIVAAIGGGPGEDMGQLILEMDKILKLTQQQQAAVDKLAIAKKRQLETDTAANQRQNEFVQNIMPAMQRGGALVSSAWATVKQIFFEVGSYLFQTFGPQIEQLMGWFEGLIDSVRKGGETMNALKAAARGIWGTIEQLGRAIYSVAEFGQLLATKVYDVVASFFGLQQTGGNVAIVMAGVSNAIWFLTALMGDGIAVVYEFAKALGNLLTGNFTDAGKNAAKIWDRITGKTGQWAKVLKEIKKPIPSSTPIVDTANLKISKPQAEGGNLKINTSSGGGKEGEKDKRDKDKEELDKYLLISKEAYEQRNRVIDMALTKGEIREKDAAKKTLENEMQFQEESIDLTRNYYAKKLGLTKQQSIDLFSDAKKFDEYSSGLDQDRYNKAFDLFQKSADYRKSIAEAQMNFEKKIFEIEKKEREKRKNNALNLLKEQLESDLELNQNYSNRKKQILQSEIKRLELSGNQKAALAFDTNEKIAKEEEKSLLQQKKMHEKAYIDRMNVENVTNEEREAMTKEFGKTMDNLDNQLIDLQLRNSDRRLSNLHDFFSKTKEIAKDAISSFGPLGASVAGTLDAFTQMRTTLAEIKKIKDANKGPDGKSTLSDLQQLGLKLAEIASVSKVAGMAVSTVFTGLAEFNNMRVAAVDAEISAQQKEIENLEKIHDLEKERNEQLYNRQTIINELAEQRIKELEHLKNQVPDAEKTRVAASIEFERGRFKNIEKMREKDAAARDNQKKSEEQKLAQLEKKKMEIQAQGFEMNRAASIAGILFNAGQALLAIWANPLAIFTGPAQAAIIGGLTAVQIATVAAQPNPYRLAKGDPFLKKGREGQDGKDSIPALLMPGEAVIPKDTNLKYRDAINAIYYNRINPDVLNNFVKGKASNVQQSTTFINEGPKVDIRIDEDGFAAWTIHAHEKQKHLDRKLHISK